MPKFEHEWVETDEIGQIHDDSRWPTIEMAANALGREGWELVSVVVRQDKPGYRHWFKRPLPESSDQSKSGQPS
jgi:hypothetical protein